MSKKSKQPQLKSKQKEIFDLDPIIGKYFYYILPLIVIVYFVYSTLSNGFYQDDEIGHFYNMIRFWDNPATILGNWAKPGYKILYVLPSLLGYHFVVFINTLLTAGTVLMTYLVGKQLKIKNSSVIALIFAFQPFILQFSFRCYAEMLSGLLVLLTLYFYYRKNNILTAIFSTWTFAVRQEFALVSIIFGVIFLIPLYKKLFDKNDSEVQSQPLSYYLLHNALPFILLGLSPVLIDILGYIAHGDPLYLLTDMKSIGVDMLLPKKGFFHYPGMFIFIVGPVSFGLFLVGYLGFIRKKDALKDYFSKYGMLFTIFTIYFGLQIILAWDYINVGANPGTLRYIVPIEPLSALIGGIGLGYIMKGDSKKYIYIILAAAVIITLAFLSYKTDKTIMLTDKEYLKFAILLVVFSLTLFVIELKMNPKIFLSLLVVLGLGFTMIDEKPMKLDPERITIQEATNWWKSHGYENRVTLNNHMFFYFNLGVDQLKNPVKFPGLLKATLKKAPVGSIVLWDSHYSNRPEYHLDVPMEYLENNPNFKFLEQFVSADRRFGIVALEKVKDY
jgi:hypothetical protein